MMTRAPLDPLRLLGMPRRAFMAAVASGLLAAPLAAAAQQAGKLPRIGYLIAGSLESRETRPEFIRQGLRDHGHVEGQSIIIEYRAAEGNMERLPVLAAELDGFVASLARLGGNITGSTFLGRGLVPKRLELLKEAVPRASRVAALWHPGAFGERTTQEMFKGMETVARTVNLQLHFVGVRTSSTTHSPR
jgi:hypothetical protein